MNRRDCKMKKPFCLTDRAGLYLVLTPILLILKDCWILAIALWVHWFWLLAEYLKRKRNYAIRKAIEDAAKEERRKYLKSLKEKYKSEEGGYEKILKDALERQQKRLDEEWERKKKLKE